MLREIVVGAVVVLLIVGGHPVSATVVVPPSSVCDFLTGGGFIVGGGASSSLAQGAKANFGVGGGLKHGDPWGHLEYNGRGTKPIQVHGTGVTEYGVPEWSTNPFSRLIKGTAEVNGVDGFSYSVVVTDKAEPGAGIDEFSIYVYNAAKEEIYSAGFGDGDGALGGGNIQLHSPNSATCP
jgi:hypothetical protein